MAEIKAFKGMKFSKKAGVISSLCCPPYDVITSEQRQILLQKNPCNIVRLEHTDSTKNSYETVLNTLNNWKSKGIFEYESENAVYIYEQEFNLNSVRRRLKGIIARVRLEEFSSGVILPHEHTMSHAKKDRLSHLKATQCSFSQVFALYDDKKRTTYRLVENLSKDPPSLELTDSQEVVHRLWVVTNPKAIAQFVSDFADKKLFIADGHHRYETALAYRDYCRKNKIECACDYQMMYLVDIQNSGLAALPTHRLIKTQNGYDAQKVLDVCRENFFVYKKSGADNIEAELKAQLIRGRKAFAYYCGNGKWYLLILKSKDIMSRFLPNRSSVYQELDVTILHKLILEKAFGIDDKNMAEQASLDYTRLATDAVEKVDSNEYQCSFLLNPTSVSQLCNIALSGEKMPQKSTYFYPKQITGLVMNDLCTD